MLDRKIGIQPKIIVFGLDAHPRTILHDPAIELTDDERLSLEIGRRRQD